MLILQPSVNDAGVELSDTGGVRSTVAENPAALSIADDGLLLFRKDGSTVGSIASLLEQISTLDSVIKYVLLTQ